MPAPPPEMALYKGTFTQPSPVINRLLTGMD